MRKQWSALIILCLLLFSITGTVSANNDCQPVGFSADHPIIDGFDTQPMFEPGGVPASATALDAISLPIHGLATAMLEENLPYDTDSDHFLWSALYHILVRYGTADERTEIREGMLILPSEVLYDFLSSFAFDRCDLPSIPFEWTERIQYDPFSDFYRITPYDPATDSIRVLNSYYSEQDLLILDAVLVSQPGNTVVSSVQVCLQPQDNLFGYCVTELCLSA